MQPAVSLHQNERVATRRRSIGWVWLVLPPLLAIVCGLLTYQLPFRASIDIGQLGDQLFLPSSQAQRQQQIDAGAWYADQIDGSGRTRWSRQRATITLPGLGASRAARITLMLSGWPADVVRADPKQPTVDVAVAGRSLGSFIPTPEIAAFPIDLPADSVAPTLTLVTSATFTDTATARDTRPKGVRLDSLEIVSGGWGTRPDWSVLLGLALLATLSMALPTARQRRWMLALLLGSGVALLGATLLIVARLWLAALLPALLIALLLLVLLLRWRAVLSVVGGLRWRLGATRALDLGLLAALIAWCVYGLARRVVGASGLVGASLAPTADRWLQVLLTISAIGGLALVGYASLTLLPHWVLRLRRLLITSRLAPALLVLAAGAWLAFLAWAIVSVPVVGHADYADNAVVARNLLRGRGWVVDYVTQFYEPATPGSVMRPQETWPLLQPVLMLPFFALLGPTPTAARLPNLVLLAALTWMIYAIGARLWDRRVGLIAALLTLVNLLFFRLAIFATSDLALVVWSMAAFWLVHRTMLPESSPAPPVARSRRGIVRWLPSRIVHRGSAVLAGLFTGLMILQKPSAAIFAIGMGLWALLVLEQRRRAARRPLPQALWSLRPVVVWTAVTLIIVSPYVIRNLIEFRSPFFSTEAYDAWIIYFRGVGGVAWEDIYKVYATVWGGPGVPDRSWILRWGWDLTLDKLWTQAIDAWNFFVPPKGTLLGYNEGGIALTWLMLIGLVTLRRRQRGIVGMVALAVGLYTLFLVAYWHTHDEPRYYVPFVPWLALLAAWGACALFDRIAAIDRGRWAGIAGFALSLALLSGVQPHWVRIDRFLDPNSADYYGRTWAGMLEAADWVAAHTQPDDVIMTGAPWQFTFYTDRPTLMMPNASYEQIMQIGEYYGADYLVTRAGRTSDPERKGGALVHLADGAGMACWELVHMVPSRFEAAPVFVYRVPSAERALSDQCPRQPLHAPLAPEAPADTQETNP